MSARKSERILNLTICLLMARRFIDRNQIRATVEGYAQMSDVAFERAFERDKDELRSMGIPLETGSNSAFFPDEVGYRIRRQDFELPPVEFTPAEARALDLAGRVWESAALAEQAVSALAKLRAAGVDPDSSRITGLAPTIGTREPAFEVLWRATLDHSVVGFGYRGMARTVEPWSLTYRRGSWFLLGFDRSRQAPRLYKLARIEGEATITGRPGAFAVPADVDLAEVARALEPAPPDTEALLAIRGDAAPRLRRQGRPEAYAGDLPPGFAAYRVAYAQGADFAAEICAHGPDVLVLAPAQLRTQVVQQLTAVAGGPR